MDDEPGMTLVLKITLERTGRFDVTMANEAEQALRLLAQYPFDLMISDVVTPGIGGIELHKIVAERYPDLPFGFLTAIIPARIKDTTIDGLPCLAKPVSLEPLLKFIDRLLAPPRKRAEGPSQASPG
jgi:DNA-binding NtrC family response regulator